MSNILSFSNWSSTAILNEDVQRAKKYLDDLYKQDDKQPVVNQDDLTNELPDILSEEPEEGQLGQVNRISKEEATDLYNQIRELLKNNDGYVYAFIKFAIDHNIPVNAPGDQDSLTKLYSIIKTDAGSLNQLPMSIEKYATMTEPINGVDSFEALMDEFKKIQTRRKHKWVIENVKGPLRRNIKELANYQIPEDLSNMPDMSSLKKPEEIEEGEAPLPTILDRLYTAAEQIDVYDQKNQSAPVSQRVSILKKSDAFSYGLMYLKAIEDTVEGLNNPSVLEKMEEIEKVSPEAELIYSKDGYMVIAVRTESAQKELFKIVANVWCINYGHWKNYAGKSDAVQYNIFNFNKPSHDPMYLVGHTIGFDGSLRNNHDRNDKSILMSSNLTQNLEKHEYPEPLIKAMVSSLNGEYATKELVQSLNIDSSDSTKLLASIITSSNSSNATPGLINLITTIAKNKIANKMSDSAITSIYTTRGILSPLSAKVFNIILPDISDSDKNQIVENNNKIINDLQKIVNHFGPEFNTNATIAVTKAEDIKNIIISGSLD
jgi:hypothetical protein